MVLQIYFPTEIIFSPNPNTLIKSVYDSGSIRTELGNCSNAPVLQESTHLLDLCGRGQMCSCFTVTLITTYFMPQLLNYMFILASCSNFGHPTNVSLLYQHRKLILFFIFILCQITVFIFKLLYSLAHRHIAVPPPDTSVWICGCSRLIVCDRGLCLDTKVLCSTERRGDPSQSQMVPLT